MQKTNLLAWLSATLVAFIQPTVTTPLDMRQTGPSYTPFKAPSYPLAVRNPYLSAWLPGKRTENLPASNPKFWGEQELGLAVMAKVGNATYSLMGVSSPPSGVQAATFSSAEFTSTHTIFKLTAGGATFTLDFFNPVSPSNFVRQSLPFSYLTISTSGASSSVEIYVDIDDAWTGQTGPTTPKFTSQNGVDMFELTVDGAPLYHENADMALWGTVVFATKSSNSTSTQSGTSTDTRGSFSTKGSLSNKQSTFAHGDVLAIANSPTGDDSSVQFVLGYVRDTDLVYLDQPRAAYYKSTYKSTLDAVKGFLDDYDSADTESKSLDDQLKSKATSLVNSKYSEILQLTVVQTFGASDITIPEDTLDTQDVMIFQKEISSSGNVNTVDVIFPTFPIWYVMAPEWIRLHLEPIMRYLATGRWKAPFAIHDIGSHYPNATGHDDGKEEDMPVEESGNLLILAQIYNAITPSQTWTNQYLPVLRTYADYLIRDGLNMSEQLSTDDGAGPLPNQTNLAIKAAIGLNAFAQLSGDTNYSTIGRNYSEQLYLGQLGTDANKTHFTLQYGNDSTYTTTFNLFADKLLNSSVFPLDAYQMQDSFYPTKRDAGGVALDSRTAWTKSDWEIWASACATSQETRDMFVDGLYKYVSEDKARNQVPFSDRYFVREFTDSEGVVFQPGDYNGYKARPVVGGHFALLAVLGGPGSVKV